MEHRGRGRFDPDGERIVDFQKHNLHVVSYSEPVAETVPLSELEPRLALVARAPGVDPVSHELLPTQRGDSAFPMRRGKQLRAGQYRVEIKSSLTRVTDLRRESRSQAAAARRCCSSRTSAIRRWRTTTPAAWR